MNYKEAILQEVQAFLLSEDVLVDVKEMNDDPTIPFDMLKFSILVGNGRMGGLHFSATVDKFDLGSSIDMCLKILNGHLMMYAIQAINAGVSVPKLEIFVPEFTSTVLSRNVAEAQAKHNVLASVVGSYDVFKDTAFVKGTKIKKPSAKTVKKVTKTKKVKAK